MRPTGADLLAMDWSRVEAGSYLVHQRMSYEYTSPITDLRHHLVVFPPRHHGDQRRITYRLDVSNADHRESTRRDAFGNLVVDLSVAKVESRIDFEAWMVVERRADLVGHRVRGGWLGDRRLLDASPLTAPDDRLREVAAELALQSRGGLDLVEAINDWVHRNMTYVPGATGVRTTAAEALVMGTGVCQDFAHVMIALCRLCGIAARYVSGHLVGDGAMHAWVEVLVPCSVRPGEGRVWAFDPTHNRRATLCYLTVAVGRDFMDVSPTRGTFQAAAGGSLCSRQSVVLTDVTLRGD